MDIASKIYDEIKISYGDKNDMLINSYTNIIYNHYTESSYNEYIYFTDNNESYTGDDILQYLFIEYTKYYCDNDVDDSIMKEIFIYIEKYNMWITYEQIINIISLKINQAKFVNKKYNSIFNNLYERYTSFINSNTYNDLFENNEFKNLKIYPLNLQVKPAFQKHVSYVEPDVEVKQPEHVTEVIPSEPIIEVKQPEPEPFVPIQDNDTFVLLPDYNHSFSDDEAIINIFNDICRNPNRVFEIITNIKHLYQEHDNMNMNKYIKELYSISYIIGTINSYINTNIYYNDACYTNSFYTNINWELIYSKKYNDIISYLVNYSS